MNMPEALPTEPHPHLLPLAAQARLAWPVCGEVRMAWRSWGEGEPVVLLHGGSGSWRHWARNIGALVADGRRVVAPDLPGLGESDMPSPPHDPPAIGALVAAGLEALLGPDTRVHLMGFSFGSTVSGQVAVRLGRRLRSLTLVGASALGLPRNDVPLTKLREKTGEARVAAHRANLAALMIADPARIDDLALAIQEWNTVYARLRSRGFAASTLLRDALARIEAPVNAIWGERDQVAHPHVEARAEAVRSVHPEADVRIIPGAGHWVAYETPDRFNAILLDMLARREAAGA